MAVWICPAECAQPFKDTGRFGLFIFLPDECANYYRKGQILELPLEHLWLFIYICRIYPLKKLLIYKSFHLGWNGKHCTLEGCPKGCNAHGQCKTNHALEWECWCDSGWFGPGCDIPMEQDCSDRKDNDQGTCYIIMKWFRDLYSENQIWAD